MAVTLADVARAAGVTNSIVSRVLNDDPTLRIRPETRDRIMHQVRELDYAPNAAARSLRMSRTGAIGLILPDVTNPIYAEILRGAESRAQQTDHVVLLGSADDLVATDQLYRELVSSGRIDGVLLQRTNNIRDAELESLVRRSGRVPTVLVNSRLATVPGSVTLDDAAGAATAVQHLVAAGHRRIAHLGGPPIVDSAQRRRRGFLDAMDQAGLDVAPHRMAMAGYSVDTGYHGMVTLLATTDRPTAVFVANLTAATGALQACRESGVRVPDDLSVIALHEAWFAAHTDPPLTTVAMPLRQLGEAAVPAVLDRIDGAEPTDTVVDTPAPRIVARRSTAPL